MERKMIEIKSKKNKHIKIGVTKGHFATNHSHVNYFVDVHSIKHRYKMAKDAARIIAMEYINTPINTIICLEGTQIIGAFLAEQLVDAYAHSINYGNDINVITPELNSSNQIIFRDNTKKAIDNKQVLLLISSVSTGLTVQKCVDCLKYYNGELVGISALFSAIEKSDEIPVSCLFHKNDIPEYESCNSGECELCKNKVKIDALINEHGYSVL